MDLTLAERSPDPAALSQHLELVQAYVRSRPGARAALMTAAQADPEGVTTSIVALGTVLLDIAAGAFALTTDQMLDKLAEGVAQIAQEQSDL